MPRRQVATGKKRARAQYDGNRRVSDERRKYRRAFDDNIVGSWATEAQALEKNAAQSRTERASETKKRNKINQASPANCLRMSPSSSHVEEDRAAFHAMIDNPITLICGACGTFNAVGSTRWHDMNYDDDYFSPLVLASTDGAPRGIYTVAIVTDPHTSKERVAVCDRCDLELRKGRVPKYSVASGFCIGSIPSELAALNTMECRLIGLGVAFTTCYKIRGSGQECTKGHSVSYWNDACQIGLSLPRPLSRSGVVRLHTRGSESSANVFTVRPNLIREALVWLIDHNPLYKNAVISEEELASLREMCEDLPTLAVEETEATVVNNVNNVDESDDVQFDYEDESFELQTGGGSRTESDEIINAIRLNDGLREDAHIDRPSSIINEYTTNTLMQACFPTLFPDGTGGFHATTFEKRSHTYELADYCAHLMRWYDRRYVMHPNFKFFCLNLIQRRQIDGLTRRLVNRRGNGSHEVDEEETKSETNTDDNFSSRAKSLLKQLKPYFRSVRGSGLYWQDVRQELMGLLGNRVLDSPYPTFFFTLSAADTVWPDFFRACDPSLTLEQAAALPAHTRRRLLNQNPDIASRHFYRRFKAFFDHVLLGKSQPLGKITDYFWRVEFQRRGSPHIHGLLWVENAPDVLKQSGTSEGRISLANFVDQHISASTYRQDAFCKCGVCIDNEDDAEVDVLAKRPPPYKDHQGTRCDIARLVSRVQQHRCYEGASCRVKTGQCRFAFPKKLQESTAVRSETGSDGAVKFEVECKRDDPYTNGFNPDVLQIWRANMDVKLVGNAFGAAEYTAAYVSKAEPDTVKFRNAIATALEKHPDSTYLSSLRRVANASIATREVSAQEALWILQRGLPMCGKSRSVLRVKTLRHAKRYYRVNMSTCLREMETSFDASPDGPRMEVIEQAYAARPDTTEFDSMSYRYFCEHYEPCNDKPTSTQRLKRWPRQDGTGYIKARTKPQAVVESPRLRTDPSSADYCFSQVFLNTPWRNVSELPVSDDECVSAFASLEGMDHIDSMERQRQLDLQAESNATLSTGVLAEAPWTFSQAAIVEEQPSDVDHPSSVANHTRTEADYETAKNFITLVVKPFLEEKKRMQTRPDAESHQKEYQYPIGRETNNMTDEQWLPFAMCMKQSRRRRASVNRGFSCEPMQIILNGEGGSGKSWLIRHIVKDVHKVWSDLGTSVRQSKRVLLMAHHGTAAFNIKGITICSALGFGASSGGFSKRYQPLEDSKGGLRTLRTLQDKYKDIQLVIVDEYSVISCAMLHWMDRRMREIWPHCRDIPFGGRDVILAGDMGQLPSVLPASLATPLSSLKNESQKAGRRLWSSISLVCTLKSQQRGIDDQDWYSALARLRSMDETDADIRLFNTRHFAQDDMPTWTQNATHIAYRNVDVDAANAECLRKTKQVIHHIQATHTVLPNLRAGDISQPLDSRTVDAALIAAEQADSSRDRSIPRALDLAVGVPVTLTHNLAQSAGLCNGTKGIIHDFVYAPSSTLPVVLVQIQDKYIGPSFIPEQENVVPIPPHALSWLSPTKSHRTTRTGLPLRLGFAMTIHKVQGLTCSSLVFNPVAIPTSTYAYVGLSRVRHRDNVILTRSLQPLKSLLQRKTRDIRHDEWRRLDELDQNTRHTTQTLVLEMKSTATFENTQ